jgi:hypothetical protein
MSTISGLLNPGAQPVALSPMNGRRDTAGITLLKAVFDHIDTDRPGQGDEIDLLVTPDGPGDIRLYLTDEAIEADNAWRALHDRGYERAVVYMNSREDSVGVSLPDDVEPSLIGCDAVLAPKSGGIIDVYVPSGGSV